MVLRTIGEEDSDMTAKKKTAPRYDYTAGRSYGHVPGHQYHDVEAVLTPSNYRGWKCSLTYVWGSCQGATGNDARDLQQHGVLLVAEYGATPWDAADEAVRRLSEHEDDEATEYAREATGQVVQQYEEAQQ